jgi:hypothetical protein
MRAYSTCSQIAPTSGYSLTTLNIRTQFSMEIQETLNMVQSQNPMERDHFGEKVMDGEIMKLIIKI